MAEKNLRIVALGGLGEIGMNCLLYEWGEEAVMVDCGVMFHNKEDRVDLIHPSFDYVIKNAAKIKALILTHGHEDHVGAVPFLLQHLDIPIYAPPFPLEIVSWKLKEIPPPRKVKLIPLHANSRVEIGPLRLEFAAVNHSIPHTLATFIRTPAGNVLHISDFKMGSPGDIDYFDRCRFEAFRAAGVDLLLSDSTNIEKGGRSGSESEVADCLKGLLRGAPRRVFVTLFPSNIRRVRSIMEIAAEVGRKIVLVGRSVKTYLAAARTVNLFSFDNLPVVPLGSLTVSDNATARPEGEGGDDGEAYPEARKDSGLLFVVAGSQGEPRSAVTRIARGEHPQVAVQPGDMFIFSSRHIPGNELNIRRAMDGLARQGASIHHIDNTPNIHVSGHAHREELEELLAITAPRAFIPVHGHYYFMQQHAQLAAGTGVSDILVLENGQVAELEKGGRLKKGGEVPVGKVYVDGTA